MPIRSTPDIGMTKGVNVLNNTNKLSIICALYGCCAHNICVIHIYYGISYCTSRVWSSVQCSIGNKCKGAHKLCSAENAISRLKRMNIACAVEWRAYWDPLGSSIGSMDFDMWFLSIIFAHANNHTLCLCILNVSLLVWSGRIHYFLPNERAVVARLCERIERIRSGARLLPELFSNHLVCVCERVSVCCNR